MLDYLKLKIGEKKSYVVLILAMILAVSQISPIIAFGSPSDEIINLYEIKPIPLQGSLGDRIMPPR